MKNKKKTTKTNPLQSITEHPEQIKHESREKMGRNGKETEPMNPMKNNRANLEIEAKKGEKHTSTNRGREPTQGDDRTPAQTDPKPSHKPPPDQPAANRPSSSLQEKMRE